MVVHIVVVFWLFFFFHQDKTVRLVNLKHILFAHRQKTPPPDAFCPKNEKWPR